MRVGPARQSDNFVAKADWPNSATTRPGVWIPAKHPAIITSIAEENRAEEQTRRAADPARRRELLASVRGMRAAWGAATPAERRRIVELLCEAAELRTGEPPVMRWRSVEELLGGK